MAEADDQLVIDVEPTRTACAGAAAACVLRRIAARAGAYAPGIQEQLFRDLQLERNGQGLDQVQRWFEGYGSELMRLGYRVMARRVAFRTAGICEWVSGGSGYRGAILPTDGRALHPSLDVAAPHAVGLVAAGGGGGKRADGLTMIDPWPGAPAGAAPPDRLEAAHRDRKYAALVLYWSGYS